MAGACDGLKVLEISRGMAGALATMVLADHGAEVIKVESPEGDPYTTEPGFRLWNRGKQRVALDLREPAQRQKVLELARAADVVVLGLRPTTLEAWGLTYEALSKDNPGLVFATITGFGWNGPYRDELAVDGMVHALSGSMLSNQNGAFRSGPIFFAPRIASYSAALLCVQGVLAALHVRETTGVGQHVDVSLLRGLVCYRGISLIKAERHQEELSSLPPARDPRGMRPLFNLNQCSDGRWISMAAYTRAFCEQALEAMGLSHLLEDPRFEGLPTSFSNEEDRMALLEILWDTFRKEPQELWLRRMDEHSVGCEPVLTVDEFRQHPQLWANDLAVRVQDPVVGPMIQPGILGHLSATPGQIHPTEAKAGPPQVVNEIVERWGRSAMAASRHDREPQTNLSRGPLAGIKVLDFTAFVAGPKCAQLLADMGADVTKVEPLEGDWFRNSKGSFAVLNRGKRGIALNLKAPEAREVLHRLVQAIDVVVYNFRLGVEDRLGLDYETLRRINPKIIVCRMTAFGIKGDRAHRPAYETSLSALSGIYMEQAGEGNPPAAAGAADISSGIAGATAILLALRARDRTGRGQAVETTMLGTMAYVMADGFVDYAGKPPRPKVDNGQHGNDPLYRLYPTHDGWLFLSATREEDWPSLCLTLDRPELRDDVFSTRIGRKQHQSRLIQVLSESLQSRTTAEWVALLREAGVPCADPLVDMGAFVTESPDLIRDAICVTLDHHRYGKLTEPGPALRFSRTPCRIERPEPGVGQHTLEVLRAVGVSEDLILDLQGHGALAVAAQV